MSITNLKKIDPFPHNGAENNAKRWSGEGDPNQNSTGSNTVYATAAGGAATTVTSNSHGLSDGDQLSVTGTDAYNGIYPVTNTNANTFRINRAFVTNEGAKGTWALTPNLADDNEFPIDSSFLDHTTGTEYHKTAAGVWTAPGVVEDTGVTGTGVTSKTNGDGKNFVTTLTLANVDLGAITGGVNQAVGALIYAFPAGAHFHEVSYMSVGLEDDGTDNIDADTPDVGIGSIIGSGAVAVLGGTATFEDYITGRAAADVGGTATVAGPLGATAGLGTGISLNDAGDVKAVHLNAADGWAAGGSAALLASGIVVLKWTQMS